MDILQKLDYLDQKGFYKKSDLIFEKMKKFSQRLNPDLQLGSQGSDVSAWQKFIGVSSDGIFGQQTAQSTRQWQDKNGLKSDGIVGPATKAVAYIIYNYNPNTSSNNINTQTQNNTSSQSSITKGNSIEEMYFKQFNDLIQAANNLSISNDKGGAVRAIYQGLSNFTGENPDSNNDQIEYRNYITPWNNIKSNQMGPETYKEIPTLISMLVNSAGSIVNSAGMFSGRLSGLYRTVQKMGQYAINMIQSFHNTTNK